MRSKLMLAGTLLMFALAIFVAMRDDRAFMRSGPGVIVRERGDTLVFEWLYPIMAPMTAHFEEAFAEKGPKASRIVIDLNSPGGMVDEGAMLIDLIEDMKRTHEVETRVGPNRVCASMCVPVYLAGDIRTASPSARFMFHEPTAYDVITDEVIDRPDFERRADSERFFRKFIDPTEMDPAFAEELRERIRGRDAWFTARELVDRDTNVVEVLK